jgi:Holliday junction DNA helicase RuvA
MITSVTGTLQGMSVTGKGAALVEMPIGLTIEVLLPAFLIEHFRSMVGSTVSLSTFCYFEGQGQGTSFLPRLIGFRNTKEREFFDLFTTVSGIGYRKALRAMAQEPASIASAISMRDAKALRNLPEIGQKMAELIITELHDKVLPFLDNSMPSVTVRGAGIARAAPTKLAPAAEDAVGALCALGETRADAERMVMKALEKAPEAKTADELITLVFAGKR